MKKNMFLKEQELENEQDYTKDLDKALNSANKKIEDLTKEGREVTDGYEILLTNLKTCRSRAISLTISYFALILFLLGLVFKETNNFFPVILGAVVSYLSFPSFTTTTKKKIKRFFHGVLIFLPVLFISAYWFFSPTIPYWAFIAAFIVLGIINTIFYVSSTNKEDGIVILNTCNGFLKFKKGFFSENYYYSARRKDSSMPYSPEVSDKLQHELVMVVNDKEFATLLEVCPDLVKAIGEMDVTDPEKETEQKRQSPRTKIHLIAASDPNIFLELDRIRREGISKKHNQEMTRKINKTREHADDGLSM